MSGPTIDLSCKPIRKCVSNDIAVRHDGGSQEHSLWQMIASAYLPQTFAKSVIEKDIASSNLTICVESHENINICHVKATDAAWNFYPWPIVHGNCVGLRIYSDKVLNWVDRRPNLGSIRTSTLGLSHVLLGIHHASN